MSIKCSDFMSRLNDINQIFKGVYNSQDKFENVWNIQDGRFIMHHENQFPSFIEVKLDTTMMCNIKGGRTAKGVMYDKFIDMLSVVNTSINSIRFFEFLKENKKDQIKSISVRPDINAILVDDKEITVEYEPDKILFDNENFIVAKFNLSNEVINSIIESKNTPFELIFDFDNEVVEFNADTSNFESFLNVKIAGKFLPYICECNESKGCKVEVEIHQTPVEYMYDVVFNVEQYKINSKGEEVKAPIEVRYGVRILEL